jgi:hypothetical protein
LTKRKHWWIYSKQGNRGKTTSTKLALADRYKAHFISDVRNAVDIPPDAQFLILDEVDFRNKPTIATLKALTSGTANLGEFLPLEGRSAYNHGPWLLLLAVVLSLFQVPTASAY